MSVSSLNKQRKRVAHELSVYYNPIVNAGASRLLGEYERRLSRAENAIRDAVKNLADVSEYEHPFLVELREALVAAVHAEEEL